MEARVGLQAKGLYCAVALDEWMFQAYKSDSNTICWDNAILACDLARHVFVILAMKGW